MNEPSFRASSIVGVAVVFSLSIALAGCGSGAPASGGASASGSPAASPSASGAPAASAVPTSCSALPSSLLSADLGGIGVTNSLSTAHLSCQFASSNAAKQVIVNLGPSSVVAFTTLKSGSAGGGRTVSQIPGLGAQAFSVAKNGIVIGTTSISANNVMYAVSSNLGLSANEALIAQWMALYH